MFGNSRTAAIAVAVALCFAAVISGPVAAETVVSDQTTLNGILGVFDLASQVTYNGSVYNYVYTLHYVSGTHTAHTFSVENIDDVEYTSAGSDPTSFHFASPTYNAAAYAYEVKWTDGVLTPGSTATFWYSSIYSPSIDIRSFAYVVNSGDSASGWSIGMGSMVPEPGSLAALGLGFAALLPIVRRRRK